jgi:hypothetical protein
MMETSGMAKSALRDLVGGGLVIVFGILLLVWLIPGYVEEDPDLRLPVATMPKVVAVLLIGFGLIQAILGYRKLGLELDGEKFPNQREVVTIAGLLLFISVATAAMAYLPYLVVGPALIAFLAWTYSPAGPIRILKTAVVGSVTIYLIIRYLFERLLP